MKIFDAIHQSLKILRNFLIQNSQYIDGRIFAIFLLIKRRRRTEISTLEKTTTVGVVMSARNV